MIFSSLTCKVALLAIAFAATFAASCSTGPDLTNINRPTPTPAASAPAEKEISGTYAVTGSAEHGADPYEGSLTITNQGDTYKTDLQTARFRRTGAGVQYGDALAMTMSEAGKGSGCGVALYKIGPNGGMDGRVAAWGGTEYASEHAQQTADSNFDGKYTVTGKSADGAPYEGTIDVKKTLTGYQFTWHTGTDVVGYGIWRGSTAAISFGGPQCYFALYDIKSTSLLDGFTGGGGSFAFGTESAQKR
ncbi:MAG: hypothetical protein ABJA02_14770 [Acidobacteriota bacterium]